MMTSLSILDHREAAAFLRRLSPGTFKQLLPQLPTDLFIESMPHSLPILEALYAKLFLAGEKIWHETRATSNLRPEAVVWQMVRFFASQEDGLIGQMRWEFCGPFISSCKRLLSALLSAEPRVRRILSERKKSLQKAIEGLGQHGMVGTSDEKLMNLHDALKLEFEKVQRSYFGALEQLEALALVNTKVNSKGQMNGFGSKAPIAQSHQRQLSLKADEIQERLIKNKTLLNVVEPTLENTPLEVLLGKHTCSQAQQKTAISYSIDFFGRHKIHTRDATLSSSPAVSGRAQCRLLTLNTHF